MTKTKDDEVAETHDGTVEPTDSVLTPYRGTPVVGSTIAVNNAGEGLSDAMLVDPIELPMGETVYVVLECEVRPPSYDPDDKNNLHGPLVLVNRLRAGTATIVDYELIKDPLEEMRGRVATEKERLEEERAERREREKAAAKSEKERRDAEERGEQPLFGDDGEPRGGEPATAGAVLDDVLGLAGDAEADDDRRDALTAEVAGWTRDEVMERARNLDVQGRSKLTLLELREAVVDAQLEQDGGA